MLKRLLLACLLALAGAMGAGAQTLVSGTVTDADSQTWNNGTFTFKTLATGQVPVTGSLSATGTYTNASIPHNSITAQVGDVWTLTVCPSFPAGCFSVTQAIAGPTLTLNVTPSAIRLNVTVASVIPPTAAYLDAEITNAYTGYEYLNVGLAQTQWRTCLSGAGSSCVWGPSPTLTNGVPGNCNVNSASPAACAAAASGVVVVPTTTTTYTVNTTIVTANSRIQVWPITDNSGVTGAPTCNAPPTPFIAYQSARVVGTSFTFTLPSTSGTSCWDYEIVN